MFNASVDSLFWTTGIYVIMLDGVFFYLFFLPDVGEREMGGIV